MTKTYFFIIPGEELESIAKESWLGGEVSAKNDFLINKFSETTNLTTTQNLFRRNPIVMLYGKSPLIFLVDGQLFLFTSEIGFPDLVWKNGFT